MSNLLLEDERKTSERILAVLPYPCVIVDNVLIKNTPPPLDDELSALVLGEGKGVNLISISPKSAFT